MPGPDDPLEPSPAELGETMSVAPGEWTPLDDIGTQIYVYGDQPVDVAVQRADADDEVRQHRGEVERLRQRITTAHETLAIEEFDGDSCPDLETTIQYAIDRYRAVCNAEAEAADRVQELRIAAGQNDQVRQLHAEITQLRAELDAIGGMRVIEHEGSRLRVITQALHNRLCRARVATPQEDVDPNILGCHFCGFFYPRAVVTRPSVTGGLR